MTMTDIESRKAEIRTELNAEGLTEEKIAELEAEVSQLESEERKIIKAAEERKTLEETVKNAEGDTIEIPGKEDKGEIKMRNDSVEYRSKFYEYLKNPSEEKRTALINVDGDANTAGDAIALPKTLDEKIWDNIHSDHPITADVTTINSGIVLEVTRHTAGTAAEKKKDKANAAGAEDNTFVKVILAGHDFQKFVRLTYAEAKMSEGALEDYLAKEIADDIGEQIATDIFARIKTDASANAVTPSDDWYADLNTALGKAAKAVNPVIYCNPANYYTILGTTDQAGQPVFRDGVHLGAQFKKDTAAGNSVIVVDPKSFVWNEISPIIVESAKDIENHRITISGYARGEGTLRDVNAAAFI